MFGRLSRRTTLLPAALVAAALAGAGIAVGTYAALDSGGGTTVTEVAVPAQPTARVTSTALTVNEIYRRASGGVVEIATTAGSSGAYPFPYGGGGARRAQGSGFAYVRKGAQETVQVKLGTRPS